MHLGARFYSEEELMSAGFRHLGENVQIKRNAGIFFTENVSIADNVRIDDFSIIVASNPDKPVVIGSYVYVGARGYLHGREGLVMEDFSTVAPGVQIWSETDDYSGGKLTNPTVPREYRGGKSGRVTLEKHVIIGAGSIILPDVTVGIGSSVGAQSLVTRSLDPWGMYAGIPVRRLRDRSKDLLELEVQLLRSE